MWSYVALVLHLTSKAECDLTGVEAAVLAEFSSGSISWLPKSQSLALHRAKDGGAPVERSNAVMSELAAIRAENAVLRKVCAHYGHANRHIDRK